MWAKTKGFTIVELLVVIVVIAILATVTIVAFNGVQARARDSQRMSDITAIDKAIKLYIVDNGHAPDFGGVCSYAATGGYDSSCYVTSDDGSHSSPYGTPHTWSELQAALQPYMKKVPVDPCASQCHSDQKAEEQYAMGIAESDGYFIYRYTAPGELTDPAVEDGADKLTSYVIVAESLETKSTSFGFGFGSF
jgi:prepilin-type N-terminal cleavage/methylation domain-containing protein